MLKNCKSIEFYVKGEAGPFRKTLEKTTYFNTKKR